MVIAKSVTDARRNHRGFILDDEGLEVRKFIQIAKKIQRKGPN